MKNKKRYWLRGGIVGLVIGILLLVVLFVIVKIFPSNGFIQSGILYLPMVIFSPFILIIGLITHSFAPESAIEQSSIGMAYLFIIVLPLSIIVGSVIYGIIIGFIYGKIKNRNKNVK